MTTATVELTRIAREGSEAVTTAVTAWSDTAARYAANFDVRDPMPAAADARAAVDTAFDLAASLLSGQRAAATTLLAAGREATEQLSERARAFAGRSQA